MAAHVPGREAPAPVCVASSWGLMQSKALYLSKSGTGVMAEPRSQGPYSVPPQRGEHVGWKSLLQFCLTSSGEQQEPRERSRQELPAVWLQCCAGGE